MVLALLAFIKLLYIDQFYLTNKSKESQTKRSI